MKIFGHPWVESELFHDVESDEDIKNSPPNSIVLLKPLSISLEIAKYCQRNSISYVVEVENINDAIFANLLGAKYTLSSKKLAKELMPIAQNYLFDTQILAKITTDSEIEEMARSNVDGVKY